MEFRVNFFFKTIIYFGWAGLGLFSIHLIFGQINTIGNWNKDKIMLLTIVFYVCNAFFKAALHNNLIEMPRYIRDGNMDFLLTKPINTRFFVSVRYFNFAHIPRLILFLLLTLKISLTLNPHLEVTELFYAFMLSCFGILGMYSLIFIISCFAFWKPRVWNLFALVSEFENLAQYPYDIFKGFLKYIVTLLPLAAFASIPTKFLLGEGSLQLFAWGISISIIFFHSFRSYLETWIKKV